MLSQTKYFLRLIIATLVLASLFAAAGPTEVQAGSKAPTKVTAVDNGNGSVTVKWKDNSSDESYFVVLLKGKYGKYSGGANVKANTTSYTFTDVVGGDSYDASVHAIGNGWKDGSATTSLIVPCSVKAPKLTAKAIGGGKISFSLTDPNLCEKATNLIYSLNNTIQPALLLSVNTTSYTLALPASAVGKDLKIFAEAIPSNLIPANALPAQFKNQIVPKQSNTVTVTIK